MESMAVRRRTGVRSNACIGEPAICGPAKSLDCRYRYSEVTKIFIKAVMALAAWTKLISDALLISLNTALKALT